MCASPGGSPCALPSLLMTPEALTGWGGEARGLMLRLSCRLVWKQPEPGHWCRETGAQVCSKPPTGAAALSPTSERRCPLHRKSGVQLWPVAGALLCPWRRGARSGHLSSITGGTYGFTSAHICFTLCDFSLWHQVCNWLVNSTQVLAASCPWRVYLVPLRSPQPL